MPAQIIQMIAFAQIMDIRRPGRSMEDHLNYRGDCLKLKQIKTLILIVLKNCLKQIYFI